MQHKLIKALTISSLITIPLTVVSCANNGETIKNMRQHSYFLDKDIQDSSSRVHMILDDFDRSSLTHFTSSLNSAYHATMLSGGFKEVRHYYGSLSSSAHAGDDIAVKYNTKIYAPADGEIIASYWIKNALNEFAEGIGGVVIERVKINNLNIPAFEKEMIYVKKVVHHFHRPDTYKYFAEYKILYTKNGVYTEPKNIGTKVEYDKYFNHLSKRSRDKLISQQGNVYLTFMHLTKTTPFLFGATKTVKTISKKSGFEKKVIYATTITPQHPLIIKAGALIGFVGSPKENGGWMPHVHIEAHLSNVEYQRFSAIRMRRYYKFDGHSYSSVKPLGVVSISPKAKKNYMDEYVVKHGIIDPNNIYNLYDEATRIIHLNS